MSMPKIAVLATGLAAAVLVATINPAPVAQAYPTPPASDCAGCHSAGGSVVATAPATLAAGAAYTVTLAFTGGSGNSGYAITGGATPVIGSAAAGATRTQAMTAPAVTTTYTVYMRQGVAASTTYTITVAPVVTTPPVTTTPPPVTTTTTTPPVTTTTPPVDPTTTTPPTTVPPLSDALISSLSSSHGAPGSTVTIAGSGFGTSGTIQFGATDVPAVTWSDTAVSFVVPQTNLVTVAAADSATVPVWYQHAPWVLVSVTPADGTASVGVHFTVDSAFGYGHGHGHGRAYGHAYGYGHDRHAARQD